MRSFRAAVVAAAVAVAALSGARGAAEGEGTVVRDAEMEKFYAYMERLIDEETVRAGAGAGARPAGGAEGTGPALVETRARTKNPEECRQLLNTWIGQCLFPTGTQTPAANGDA